MVVFAILLHLLLSFKSFFFSGILAKLHSGCFGLFSYDNVHFHIFCTSPFCLYHPFPSPRHISLVKGSLEFIHIFPFFLSKYTSFEIFPSVQPSIWVLGGSFLGVEKSVMSFPETAEGLSTCNNMLMMLWFL